MRTPRVKRANDQCNSLSHGGMEDIPGIRKRVRERQIVSLKYVDKHDRPKWFAQILYLLPVVGLGNNW